MGSDLIHLLKEDPQSWWIDRMYLQDAWKAARISINPRTQVGAALVIPGTGVVMKSCNRFPSKLESSGYPRTEDDIKYCMEHAERSVIFKVLENSIVPRGITLYSTWASCCDCARTIIHFGISRVVTLTKLVEHTPERWKDSVRAGLVMLNDCGVQVVGWRGNLGIDESLLFDSRVLRGEDME